MFTKTIQYEVTRIIDPEKLDIGSSYEVSREEDKFCSKEDGKMVFAKRIMATTDPGHPGVYKLVPGSYGDIKQKELVSVSEKNLDYISQIDLVSKTQKFFDAAPKIQNMGLLARRGILLYGKPGCGKTHQLSTAIQKLRGPTTAIYSMSLDEVDANDVIRFFMDNAPQPSVTRLIIVIEDLGGAEVDPAAAARISKSGLLSFLDGTQGAWPVPTAIFATTNYPQNFLENIIDRPGRFDEVIEIDLPTRDTVIKYISELLDRELNEFEIDCIWKGMSIAHAKEAVVRTLIYEDELASYLGKMKQYSDKAQNAFERHSKMGL